NMTEPRVISPIGAQSRRRRDALAAVAAVHLVAPAAERRELRILSERRPEHRPHARVELEEVVVRIAEYGREHARNREVGAREGGAHEVASGSRGAREIGQHVLEEGYRALLGTLRPVVLGGKVVRQRLDAELLELADEREARVRREHLAR